MPNFLRAGGLALASALIATMAVTSSAMAQMPGPPSTVMGSIADSEGDIPADLPVVAYVGDTECGRGKTYSHGEGDHQVTLYAVDVVSEGQTPGCGSGTADGKGVEIRLKVGDRFAPQKANWKPGAVRLDLTFGDATPAPIPTSTPTPPRAANQGPAGSDATPIPGGQGSGGRGGDGSGEAVETGTIPAGSPGAGSPVPTKRGGVTQAGASGGGDNGDGDGGFPVWAVVVLVLGGVGAIGGGVGFAMSRSRNDEDADQFAN